jgi:DNA-binding CsgD family transcriptional regulator
MAPTGIPSTWDLRATARGGSPPGQNVPMATATWRSLADRLRDVIGPDLGRDELAELLYGELARCVPYSFACLATTDPASGVITWASKTRSLGVGDEEFAASEYGPADINKFEDIARRRPPAGGLSLDTGGRPERCRRHREFMAPRFGFTDELRAVFVSRATSWGALGLYRGPSEPPFTAAEVAQVGEICDVVAAAIQRSLFRLPGPPQEQGASPALEAGGPAVLIVDGQNRATQLTPAALALITELGGWDHGSLPANILAVVATTRSTQKHFSTRTLSAAERWMSLRAAPLDGADGQGDVVVSIEPTPRATLSRLALAAHGLTAREEEVAILVLQGANTQGICAALHLSPHTVQDHLKAIFSKVGVSSRRELTARLVLI